MPDQNDVQANVVLSADTSQYNQSMQASAQQTDALGKSIDTLSGKLESLTKRAGRTFVGFAAADVASITAATAAYAAYEKQLTSLSAQTAVLNKSMDAQKRDMNGYVGQINSLRRAYGDTTGEAAQLVQTISKMSDNTTAPEKLTNTFAKLGQATQESSTNLANSMLQLQRTMGTPQRDTEKFANQLSVLQARSNSSASSILDFANSIAPVGRLVNMTQTDIMGFSNAFIKAGQDGYQASNVFNKMLSDIAYSVQSGSPDLAKYANLVGMTTQQFKDLGGTNQILSIFDAINRQGPQAITTLNRMGYDGMRTVRTITAMSQQSGGLTGELNAARMADPDAMNRGAAAANQGIVDSLKRLRAEVNQTAESFGSNFAPAARGFINVLTGVANAGRIVMDSPIGKIGAWATAAVAPIAALTGSVLLAAKALGTFATARAVLTGAFAGGIRESRNMSQEAINGMNLTGTVPGVGPGRFPAGRVGGQIAENGSWTNRFAYNRGADLGRLIGPRSEVSLGSRLAGWGLTGIGRLTDAVITPQYTPGAVNVPGLAGSGGYDDVTRRMRFFNSSTLAGSFGGGPGGGMLSRQLFGFRQGLAGISPLTPDEDRQRISNMHTAMSRSAGSGASDAKRLADAEKYASRMSRLSSETETLTKSTMSVTRGLGNFGGSMTRLIGVMGASGVGALQWGAGAAGKVGMSAMNGLGISPWMLGIGGAIGGYELLKQMRNTAPDNYQDTSGFSNPYLQAGGASALPSATLVGGAKASAPTISSARQVSKTDVLAASDSTYKLTNSSIKGLSRNQAVARLTPQMSYIKDNPQSLQAVKMDLVNQFGASEAEMAMNQLMSSGGQFDYGTFIDPAASGRKDHWYSTDTSSAKPMKDLNQLSGAMKDQLDAAYASGGTNSALQLRGKQFTQAVGEFARNLKGNVEDTRGQRTAFNKFIFARFFGVTLTDDEAAKIDTPEGNLSNNAAAKQYLDQLAMPRNTLRKSQGGNLAPISTDRMNAVISMMGLTPGVVNQGNFGSQIFGSLVTPGKVSDTNSLDSRLARMASGSVFGLGDVKNALDKSDNPAAQYSGAQAIYQQMVGGGLSPSQIQRRLGNFLGTIGDDTDQRSQLALMTQALNNRTYNAQLPTMSRTGQFGAETSMFTNTMATNIGGSTQNLQNRQGAIDTYAQQVEEQRQYFQSMLLQQREFDIQRSRSEYDFDLQRTYAQEDFARSRARAEEDYNIQRSRAEADFSRQMGRNQSDYALQRKRDEEDHQHQVTLMISQQAQQMYNMYQRVNVQRTASASWLLVNGQDQTRRMQQQESDLNTLRKRGLSTNAINQLGLTDSSNQQQLSRIVSETTSDPNLIKQFNAQVAARLKAAASLVTDKSSTDWTEFERSFNLSRDRSQQDFEKSMKRAKEDFTRSLSQQDDDFKRSISRQQQDFGISMTRQEEAFNLSMQRSADDLSRSAQTIDGNFTDILTKAVSKLSGHAKAQAQVVLSEFNALKGQTGAASADIMSTIATIFGVKYTAPKVSATQIVGNADSGFHVVGSKNIFKASGGVLPGYTPGVDVHTFADKTGNQLHLSGGEAIMVPEWTKAVGGAGVVAEMNRRAKSQSFASGGVMSNVGNAESFARAQVGKPYTWGAVGPDGYDCSGFMSAITNVLRGAYAYQRVGSTASFPWPGFEPGPGVFTIGSTKNYGGSGVGHMAGTIMGLNVESRGGTGPIVGSQARGYKDSGFNQVYHLGTSGNYGYGGSADSAGGQTLKSILKAIYPKPEESAASMSALHPLAVGDISSVINTAAKASWGKMVKKYGNPDMAMGAMSALAMMGDKGISSASNERIVHAAMLAAGFNNGQWSPLVSLVNSESHFNNTAQNPTSSAYGMFQFLDSTWKGFGPKTADPTLQAKYGMQYIKSRYGNPAAAWAFHQAHNWYGDGAIFNSPSTIGVGERGPEAVIPLNDKGTDFMVGLMQKMSAGWEAKLGNVRSSTPMASHHNEYHYKIDRSTTFSGAITVAANNPAEMISQLQARQRVLALSQPSLGGTR